MSFSNWEASPETVLTVSSVMPVVQIKELEHAIPLAEALFAKGINAMEVTLRTSIAFEAIRLLTQTFPDALIGVGTVIMPQQLVAAENAGARFAFSPGLTPDLLQAGKTARIPFIPGIASASELMQGLASGYTHFKFFPAVAAGGIPMLHSLYSPFPQVKFCPTGGINETNYKDYLALPNVLCVGGSWVVSE